MKPSMEDVDARSALGLTAGKRFRLQELPARRKFFLVSASLSARRLTRLNKVSRKRATVAGSGIFASSSNRSVVGRKHGTDRQMREREGELLIFGQVLAQIAHAQRKAAHCVAN